MTLITDTMYRAGLFTDGGSLRNDSAELVVTIISPIPTVRCVTCSGCE